MNIIYRSKVAYAIDAIYSEITLGIGRSDIGAGPTSDRGRIGIGRGCVLTGHHTFQIWKTIFQIWKMIFKFGKSFPNLENNFPKMGNPFRIWKIIFQIWKGFSIFGK